MTTVPVNVVEQNGRMRIPLRMMNHFFQWDAYARSQVTLGVMSRLVPLNCA